MNDPLTNFCRRDGVTHLSPTQLSPASLHRTRAPHGFTLIELLVVISIISLLVGILLPALSSARTAAKSVVCGTQLKQVALGVELYRTDYDDYFLPISVELTPGDANSAVRWGVFLRPYLSDQSTGNTTEKDNILYCPEVPPDNRHASGSYVSYGYNRWGVGGDRPQADGFPKVLRSLKSPPGQTLMMIDIERISDPVRRGWFEAYPGTFFHYTRHNDAANTLFADSHVSTLKIDEILTDTSVTTNNEPWYGDNTD